MVAKVDGHGEHGLHGLHDECRGGIMGMINMGKPKAHGDGQYIITHQMAMSSMFEIRCSIKSRTEGVFFVRKLNKAGH